MRMKLFPIVLVLAFAQSVLAKDPVVTIEPSNRYWGAVNITVEGENYTLRTDDGPHDWQGSQGQMNRELAVTGKGIYQFPRRIKIVGSPSNGSKRELYSNKNLFGYDDFNEFEIIELLVFGVMPLTAPAGSGIQINAIFDKKIAEFLDSIGFGPDIAAKDSELSISGPNAFNKAHKLLDEDEATYVTANGVKYCLDKTHASFWMADFKNDKFVQASKKRFPNLTVIDKRIKKADLDDRKASEPSSDTAAAANLVAGAISSLAQKVD